MNSNFLYIELFQYLALAWIGYVLWQMKRLFERFLAVQESKQRGGEGHVESHTGRGDRPSGNKGDHGARM